MRLKSEKQNSKDKTAVVSAMKIRENTHPSHHNSRHI